MAVGPDHVRKALDKVSREVEHLKFVYEKSISETEASKLAKRIIEYVKTEQKTRPGIEKSELKRHFRATKTPLPISYQHLTENLLKYYPYLFDIKYIPPLYVPPFVVYFWVFVCFLSFLLIFIGV